MKKVLLLSSFSLVLGMVSTVAMAEQDSELIAQACNYARNNCDITACLEALPLTPPLSENLQVKLYTIGEQGSLAPVFDIVHMVDQDVHVQFRPHPGDSDVKRLCPSLFNADGSIKSQI